MIPHYQLDGPDDAPVVVFSNSLGADLHMWDAQVAALGGRFRVLRYDHRGHGRSAPAPAPVTIDDMARDVVDLLDHVGVAAASFCGLSLGGMVGMALARLVPERVDRLLLCCTSAHLEPAQGWRDRGATVRRGGMAAVADAVVARWFTPSFAATQPLVVDGARRTLLAVDPGSYAACCDAIADMDQLDALSVITAPTLVVAADADPATPPDHADRISAHIRGSRVVVVDGASHLANVERPDVVNRLLMAHLAPDALLTPSPEDRYAAGMRVRRQVLGDAHVDAAALRATDFTADFQDLVTRYAWGEIWTRPGLDRRTRSCITVAMLVALGRDDELVLHLRAARRNGVTVDELKEVLLQTAIYCGVPAANHAFSLAAAVLAGDEPDADAGAGPGPATPTEPG